MEITEYTFLITLSGTTDFITTKAGCLNDVFKEILSDGNIRIENIESIYRLCAMNNYTFLNNINVELVYHNHASY